MKRGDLMMIGLFAAGVGGGLLAGSRRSGYSFTNRVVVITGARGLALVTARELAREGAKLVLLARDGGELQRAEEELSQCTDVLTLPCDVRDRTEVEVAIERVIERFGRVDVLMNNAGVIQVGPIDEMTVADFEDALAVHLYGPLFTMLAVQPHMERQGGGRIINISSIGGEVAVPHLVPYCASKFALTGLSEGMRTELLSRNIKVTTVCPGLMRTGSPPNAKFKGQHRAEYAWFAIGDSLPLLTVSAEHAARQIIEACRRGQARLNIGLPAKTAALLNQVVPGAVSWLSATVNRVLPGPSAGPRESHRGWESGSAWAPSVLTWLSDRAAERNNELLERPRAGATVS